MKSIILAKALVFSALATGALAQTANILPNGMTQFLDANGKPLANGQVFFYIPSTTTPKTTWQDPNQVTPNANPVVLNGAGEAVIWGLGTYRQEVFDQFSNLIWDKLTAGGGGVSTGTVGQLAYYSSTLTLSGTPTGTGVLTALGNGVNTAGGMVTSYLAPGSGGVSQSVGSKLQQTINVLDYGAKCDGSTNDIAAFIAATTAATAAANGVLVLPGGNCVLTAGSPTWSLPNALLVEGQGKYKTNVTCTNGTGICIFVQSASTGSHLTQFGVTATGMSGIQFGDSTHSCTYCTADYMSFAAGAINVSLYNCVTCHIQNNDFNAGYTAEAVAIQAPLNTDAGDSWINNNWIIGSNGTLSGILYISGGGWKIYNNKIITNNYAVNGVANAPAQNLSALQIIGNSFENCTSSCIYLTNSSTTTGVLLNVVIANNEITTGATSGSNAIWVPTNGARAWVQDLSITGNVINVANSSHGIYIDSTANFVISGNMITDTGTSIGAGILAGSLASNAEIGINTIVGYTTKLQNLGTNIVGTANGP